VIGNTPTNGRPSAVGRRAFVFVAFALVLATGACRRDSLYGMRSESGGGLGRAIEILPDKPDAHPDTIGSARFPYQDESWPMTVRRAGRERYELWREDKVVGVVEWSGGNWIDVTFVVDPPYLRGGPAAQFAKGVRVPMRADTPGVFF
jgi:hypothetical protein